MDSFRSMITRCAPWLKLGYLLFGTGIIYFLFSHHVYDDPFITYRFAENLGKGFGFVYNQGERVLSTSTPLFALLLASLWSFWSELQPLANFVGAFSLTLGGLFLWELGRTWQSPFVGWSGLLLYPTFPLVLSTMSSETPLFLAFSLGALLLYAKKNLGWASIFLALAILTRSDGVLLAAIIGIHYLWVNRTKLSQAEFWRQQPWSWLILALGLLVVWHGFAWFYFGAPLPVTLAAKQAQGRMAISQLFAPGILRVAGWYSSRWHYWVELGLFGIGVIFTFFGKRQWLLIFGWTGLYFLAYALLGVTSYFWYYAPLVPGWVVAVGLGFTFFYWLPLPDQLRTSHFWNRIRLGLLGLILTSLFVAQVSNLQMMSQRIDPRYAIYSAAGEWLADNTPPDAHVGALEVGIIGYYAQRSMVDFAGLIQPEVAEQMQVDTTYDDTAIWAVKNINPIIWLY